MENEKEITITNAVLCALIDEQGEEAAEVSLDELERLLDTAGGKCFAKVTQSREKPDVRTYFGKGKSPRLPSL